MNVVGEEEHILFEVSDTGLGISKDELDKLFISFSQVDGSYTRKYSGTGLGLAISKQLVEKMGGRIWVNSEKGKGSTFAFTIRLEEGNMKEAAEEKHVTAFTAERKLNILLVEDDKINQIVIGRMLKEFGHSVVTVNNGMEAIKVVFNQKFDLVLMDIQMPEMDGITATKYIREKEKAHNLRIPVIALTAHAIQGDRERFLNYGMDAYVPKPVIMDELFKAIEEAVNEKTALSPAIEIKYNERTSTLKESDGKCILTDLMSKLKKAMDDNNISLLEKYSHLIKEYSESFGMDEMRQNAFKVELNARKNKLTGIKEYIDNMESLLK
jgi:CheY-like chemotaxis protein